MSTEIGPSDVPAERPAALDALKALVGKWETEASFEAGFFALDSPAVSGRGRTTFEWFDEQFFLVQRATAEEPAAPSGIMIIGLGPRFGGLRTALLRLAWGRPGLPDDPGRQDMEAVASGTGVSTSATRARCRRTSHGSRTHGRSRLMGRTGNTTSI